MGCSLEGFWRVGGMGGRWLSLWGLLDILKNVDLGVNDGGRSEHFV